MEEGVASASHEKTPARSLAAGASSGGPKRDRTADLHNAIVALSQLSYGPELKLYPSPLGLWGRPENRAGT